MPCWRFWAANNGSITWQHFACGTSAYYQPSGGANNSAYLMIDGVAQGHSGGIHQFWTGGPYSRGIDQVQRAGSGDMVTGGCGGCEGPPPPPPSSRYDCVNGSCLEKSKFSTPGIYESLSACEQNCGPGCGGVCISNADWTKIRNLAAMVKNKDCS